MKILKFLGLLVAAIIILAAFFYFRFNPVQNTVWGVNFSIPHAQYLGLDFKKVYLNILDELKAPRLRIMAYWEIVEPRQGQYNFSDIDFLLSEAEKRNIKVILVIGHKQPGWPECHHPEWYESLAKSESQAALTRMLETAVKHFQNSKAIYAWQIENEPFFAYGLNCPVASREDFERELSLVKSIDDRPIVVTDSGEKGAWLPTAWAGGDIFGSTMYRKVYHSKKQKYVSYAIPPALYRVKAGLVKSFSNINKFIGVELQAEPWFASDVYSTAWEKQTELMNPQILADNVEYARRAGFAENYFWGVEWWYWAKSQGHPEMWEAAKKIINNQ